MSAASTSDRTAAESARLADLLRSSDATAIGAEPALAGAVEAISLAARYFEAAAQRSGEAHGVEPAMAQFREIMASAIERGEPVALRPEYQAQLNAPPREAAPDIARDVDVER